MILRYIMPPISAFSALFISVSAPILALILSKLRGILPISFAICSISLGRLNIVAIISTSLAVLSTPLPEQIGHGVPLTKILCKGPFNVLGLEESYLLEDRLFWESQKQFGQEST